MSYTENQLLLEWLNRLDNGQNSVKRIDYHCDLNCSYMHVSDSYQTHPLYLFARVFNRLTIKQPLLQILYECLAYLLQYTYLVIQKGSVSEKAF